MTIKQSAWTGVVPVDDTALYVTDTDGRGRPVVYLNGAYADQSHWRRVIADLGSDYRHITYDERARGKSKRSADYSFEACFEMWMPSSSQGCGPAAAGGLVPGRRPGMALGRPESGTRPGGGVRGRFSVRCDR